MSDRNLSVVISGDWVGNCHCDGAQL